jgi:HAT1-interacting factor 1
VNIGLLSAAILLASSLTVAAMASTAFDSRLETVSGEATDNANLTQINTMDDLVAQATAKYALKDYTAAAELYSRAAELQAEINGEMSSRNADLLYSYGRCLYHVAVSKSDILGSRVVGDKQEESAKTSTSMQGIRQVATNGVGSPFTRIGREDTTSSRKDNKVVQSEDEKGKLFFQFSGDENFDDSEEEDEGNDADGETEEAEDDFSNAYEVLDLARLLLQRNLRERQEHGGERTAVGDAEAIKQLKERLADTHDLLAEISLENEKFPAAVADLKAALKLKQDIFPQHSSLIAEAHFKLSLALEFSSITGERDSNGEVKSGKQAHVDKVLREEAATQMEAAIESCNIRIGREEATIDSGKPLSDTRKAEITRESIDNVREMVKDMEQRVGVSFPLSPQTL